MDEFDAVSWVVIIAFFSFIVWENDGGIFSKEMTIHYISEQCSTNSKNCSPKEFLRTTFRISEESQQVIGIHHNLENTELQKTCKEGLFTSSHCSSDKLFILTDCIVMNKDNWSCDYYLPGFRLIGRVNGDWITTDDREWTSTSSRINIEVTNWKIFWWLRRTLGL